MDQLLVNLKLLGSWDHDLSSLGHYVQLVSRSVDCPIPNNYPVFGDDAFRTATGVHAAAIIKASRSGDQALADVVYSGVPAHLFGLSQQIEIGKMSGKSNVIFWLESRNYPTDDSLVLSILKAAHRSESVMSDDDLHTLVRNHRPQ